MRLINFGQVREGLIFFSILFGLVWQSGQASTIIHESATLGATGQMAGYDVDSSQFLGSRFYLGQQVDVTSIGGHMWNSPGDFFGAIISLSDHNSFPVGSPFTGPEVVSSTVFDPGYPSSDFRTPLSVTLGPGYYALVFGTGQFGSSGGDGAMPYAGQTDFPVASYFFWNGSGWYDSASDRMRFVIEGDPNTGSALVYCGASGGGDEYISGVVVGTINNTGTGNNGYYDYTSLSTTMEVGVGYAITVTNGNHYFGDQCGIWVDWLEPTKA